VDGGLEVNYSQKFNVKILVHFFKQFIELFPLTAHLQQNK